MTITTPARAHFARVSAAQAAAAAAPGETMTGATPYELRLHQLALHRRALKAVQSIARKVELKRKILPEYADYVAGAISAGRGAQDDVLVTVMVWRIDTGDYAGALDIASYAIAHGLTMPEHFDRSIAAIVAEQFADAALTSFLEGGTFNVASLDRIAEMTEGADMHDQIRAKLYKALGYALRETAPERALYYLRLALKFNERAGVKKDIDRLEKSIAVCRESGDGA